MKKKVLIIVALIVILGVSLFILTGCGNKNEESTSNNSSTTTENSSASNESDVSYTRKYFDTSKFDKTKFSGVVYDKDVNSYKVSDLIPDSEDGTLNLFSDGGKIDYYFTTNTQEEIDTLKEQKTSDIDLEFIKNILGDPTCIYEQYSDGSTGRTFKDDLIYNYGDFVVLINLLDYTNWKGYSYTSPRVMSIYIVSKETWLGDTPSTFRKEAYNNYELYGTEVN